MPPNQKNVSFVVQTLDLPVNKELLQPPPSLVTAQSSSASSSIQHDATIADDSTKNHHDYWTWNTNAEDVAMEEDVSQEQDVEYYWNWSSNPHAHVLTTQHIEANLIKTRFTEKKLECRSGINSDDYWCVATVKDQERLEQQKLADQYWMF